MNQDEMISAIKTDNPWNIQSIYELQFFGCPSCIYINISKQSFIEHAYEIHPESIAYLSEIKDGSLRDDLIEFMPKRCT